MEPFSVICETCRARLKVRSASVVSEIHPCPKCGSMVQIVAPAGLQSVASPTGHAEASLPTVMSAAELIPEIGAIESAAPMVPVAASTSPIVLWGVSGALLLLVGGLIAGMSFRGKDAPNGSAAAASNTAAEQQIEKADDSTPAERDVPPVDSMDVAQEPVEPLAESVAKPDEKLEAAMPELPADAGRAERDDEQPIAADVATLPAPSVENEPRQTAAAPTERRRRPVMKFDPLDFDPSQLSLAPSTSSQTSPSSGSIPDDAVSEVASVAGNIGEAGEPSLPPPVDHSLTVRLGPMPSGASRPHKVAEQLALRVASLEITDVPLSRFVEMLSDMVDVPITLDPMALELAGVSPGEAVTINGTDVTVEKLLHDGLAKQRLAFIELNGHVKVTLGGGDRRRAVDYEVADLVHKDDAKQLVSLVQRFVAPATWQAAGGSGVINVVGTKLHIEHAQSVRHQALIFCERLRLARGLAIRSRYPAALLSIESPYVAMAPNLNQRTTFTFLPWSRLADVVRHWQEASGLTILVDWSALADAELGPSSPIACSVINRTWEESLDGILAPLGLAWWAIDGQTVQIATREALDEIEWIEFYAVPKRLRDQLADNAAVIDALQTELREHTTSRGAKGDDVHLELDEPSGRLIVLARPLVHRYLSAYLSGQVD